MDKKVAKIIIGAIIYLIALFIKTDIVWVKPVLFLIGYIIIGGDILIKAIRNIMHGNLFDENFLMSVATIGAFSIKQFPEAVAVMLFYQVGELFQNYAVNKSRKSIATLMDIRPDYANLKNGEEIIRKNPDEIKVGDYIIIQPGEKIPLDGEIVEGHSTLNTSALTGETVPREVSVGETILSGCININGVLTVKVAKEFGESTVTKILDLVENATSKKTSSENFITKFAKIYTPIVVVIALLLAVIPPLISKDTSFSEWLYRALSFLVVSCPCALVISIPLSFFAGIGGTSKKGVLVKGSNYLEALAKTEIVIFDKTGTLTKGVFKVQEINPINISEDELLEITAYAESHSTHPISVSLKEAYGKEIDTSKIKNIEEIAGHGIKVNIDNKEVLVGNSKLMELNKIAYKEVQVIGTIVYVSIDNKYVGNIVISDEIKEDSINAIKSIRSIGIKKIVMLTGDSNKVAKSISDKLEINEYYAGLLPTDKVNKLEELLKQKSDKGKLVFVGDGINDAPVLGRADIGIAMGGLGSDAAIEAADVVIMTDEPSKITTSIKISKKTLKIVHENIIFAISIKIAVLILSALGIVTMWGAVFADVGVSVLAILNAFRALKVKQIVNINTKML